MKYFVYQIVGRGDIILSRSVDVGDNTYHTFKFLATFAMMPRAKLLIYMVVNGEFVYDEQIIEFEENLLNKVTNGILRKKKYYFNIFEGFNWGTS